MNVSYGTFALIIILLGGGALYFFNDSGFISSRGSPMQVSNTTIDIEKYVTENISSLSPEKATLGGTFYVTDIEAAGGRGVVEYEDGHNAYVADFEYFIDKYGITVSSFEVRR